MFGWLCTCVDVIDCWMWRYTQFVHVPTSHKCGRYVCSCKQTKQYIQAFLFPSVQKFGVIMETKLHAGPIINQERRGENTYPP